MSYTKRTPCQKYYDKTNKDGLHKSLSATRFVPFGLRRSSDTTSDSSDDFNDFKIEAAEEVSSRSSSESGANSRYHCILKDLNEIKTLNKTELNADVESIESLSDFRSRLNLRRKIKTREVFLPYQDDDRTDNSCDSATTKAHQEILRSANLLKQEKVERHDDFGKKSFHSEVQCSYNKRFTKPEVDFTSLNKEETLLMNQFDKILQIPSGTSNTTSIARSSTETFLSKTESSKHNAQAPNPVVTSSPRFRPKTRDQRSQMLKAATSIPSLIFSNKGLKLQKSTNNMSFAQSSEKLSSDSKKNSIDEDFFGIGSNKTRRSPLRFLGNFVDDKLFRGKWSSAKRTKSTDEITWALANEDLMGQNDIRLSKDAGGTRKKSLGLLSTTSASAADDIHDKKRYRSGSDKARNMSDFIYKKILREQPNSQRILDMKKRKSSNTSSDMLSISGSSAASLNGHFEDNHSYPNNQHGATQKMSNECKEISAETLAEIDAFEMLLNNHLQS